MSFGLYHKNQLIQYYLLLHLLLIIILLTYHKICYNIHSLPSSPKTLKSFTKQQKTEKALALLNQLTKIDDRTKHAVYGWIREKQQSLNLNNIPNMITAICILFFRKDERFEVVDDERLQFSSNLKRVTRLKYAKRAM